MLKRKISTLATYARLGPKSAILYGRHMMRLRSGHYLKRLPVGKWGNGISGKPLFNVPSLEQLGCIPIDRESLLRDADRIADGEFKYFCHTWHRRPESWSQHPLTGVETAKAHWAQVGEFDEKVGDIKWIWDASRFEWAYALGRAFAVSADEKYAEAFWRNLESWRDQNPPNLGCNWRCAQECSLRLIALVWSASAFGAARASTEEQLGKLWEIVYRLALRIEETLGYGIAQNNNHAISEATALLVAGACLQIPESPKWQKFGIEAVSRYIAEQFEPDGSYILHAFNYQRTTMKVCMVAALAARSVGQSLSKEAMNRLEAGTRFLFNLQDEKSGALPNYGANDGSNTMALSGCEFKDFRATIQSLGYLTTGKRVYEPGFYDEEGLWIFGSKFLRADSAGWKRENVRAENGGYYSLRTERAMALTRCHTYKSRPLHADMLHIDFWLDGRNIAHDPGTYSYFDSDGAGAYLTETAAHNTVTVDKKSQMDYGRRFLWLNWTRSKILRAEKTEVAGEHYGYRQIGLGVVHRRQMRLEGSALVVTDELECETEASHEFDLRWHLDGSDWALDGNTARSEGISVEVSCELSPEISLKVGEKFLPETGFSRYYGCLDAATVLSARLQASGHVRFTSRVQAEE